MRCILLMETREARYAEEMREYVEAICDHHLYLEITRMDWRERFKLAAERHYRDLPGGLLTDLLRERDITWIPSQIQVMQEQALALIEGMTDIEGEKAPFRKRLADYYARNSGSDTLRNLRTGWGGHEKQHRGTIERSFSCAVFFD